MFQLPWLLLIRHIQNKRCYAHIREGAPINSICQRKRISDIKHDTSGVAVELLSVSGFIYSRSCFDQNRPNHLIKLLHTTPCYVSPRDTLASGNDMTATNCHLIGCLLSHNGCLLSSLFTAGFGSVTRITHTSIGSIVWLHFLSTVSDSLDEEVLHMAQHQCYT